MARDLLRGAAESQMLETGVSVGGHDDEIGVELVSDVTNFRARSSAAEMAILRRQINRKSSLHLIS